MKVLLREVRHDDLEAFFVHQSDAEAARIAGVEVRPRDLFDARWKDNLANPASVMRTIEADGQVAGYVCSWHSEGVRHLGYVLGRAFWNRGVASEAVRQFLTLEPAALQAEVTPGNVGSWKVLEKNGFTLASQTPEDRIYTLPAAAERT